MARQSHKLSARKVDTLTTKGRVLIAASVDGCIGTYGAWFRPAKEKGEGGLSLASAREKAEGPSTATAWDRCYGGKAKDAAAKTCGEFADAS